MKNTENTLNVSEYPANMTRQLAERFVRFAELNLERLEEDYKMNDSLNRSARKELKNEADHLFLNAARLSNHDAVKVDGTHLIPEHEKLVNRTGKVMSRTNYISRLLNGEKLTAYSRMQADAYSSTLPYRKELK